MSGSQRPSRQECSVRFTSSRHARLIACSAALLVGCDKSVGPFEVLPPLEPASLDPTAGTWKMIALTGATQVAVAAPTAVSSPAYVAELDAIKSSQASLT